MCHHFGQFPGAPSARKLAHKLFKLKYSSSGSGGGGGGSAGDGGDPGLPTSRVVCARFLDRST